VRAILIALALGVVSTGAFEPLAIPGLMILTLAGFFALLRTLSGASARLVLAVGFSFGLGFMGPLIWWMNAVDRWAWVGLVLFEAAFIAGVSLALRSGVHGKFWPIWAAAIWTAGELLRGSVPLSGFPWGRLGHTAIDTPFEGWVRLVSIAGTSFLMAVLAGLLVVAVTERRWWPLAASAAVIAVGTVLPTGIASAGQSRTIAVVQGNTPGDFLSWPRGEIFDLHVAGTRKIDQQVDLVLWPENGSDLDVFTDPVARATVTKLAADVDAPILVGAILNGPTDKTAYNASVKVDKKGPHKDFYVKQNVVPYGEYVPFRNALGRFVPRFDRDIPRDMLAGDRPGVMSAGKMTVGLTICWDIAYDAAVRESVNRGAQFLAVQTSNASFMDFGSGVQPQQQWAISRLRAIETGRWLAVASTNGISGVVDPTGHVVQQAPVKEPATLVQDIVLANGRTPATILGFATSLVIWLIAVAGLAFGNRELRKGSR